MSHRGSYRSHSASFKLQVCSDRRSAKRTGVGIAKRHEPKKDAFCGIFLDRSDAIGRLDSLCGGPTRIRTWNQGIRGFRLFPVGADYLFARSVRCWVGAGRSSL